MCRRCGSMFSVHQWESARNKSSFARPYICRFISLSLVFCPSVCPFDHGSVNAALTAHLVRPANEDADHFLHDACEGLARTFNIGHSTLQVEVDGDHACRLAPAEAV